MRKPTALVLVIPLLAMPILAGGPANARATVKTAEMERTIEKGVKKQAKVRVDITCPKKVTWVKGKVFYCKLRAKNGVQSRVRIKLGSETTGLYRWSVKR
jgi:hypothetical protein